MNPVKCPECGLTVWSTELSCKRCQFVFEPMAAGAVQAPLSPLEDSPANVYESEQDLGLPPAHGEMPQMAAPMGDGRHPENHRPETNAAAASGAKTAARFAPHNAANFRPPYLRAPLKTKNGLAVASMILGAAGFLTMIALIGFPVAIAGLIAGIVALIRANKQPHVYGGKVFAIIGVALSTLVVLCLPIVAAIAIPNLLAARRAANEASALSGIQQLLKAEADYMAARQTSRCGELRTLGQGNFIDPVLAAGEKNGYRFLIVNSPFGCEITATPISTSTGTRSFYFSTEDQVLRAAEKNGSRADQSDAPLGN